MEQDQEAQDEDLQETLLQEQEGGGEADNTTEEELERARKRIKAGQEESPNGYMAYWKRTQPYTKPRMASGNEETDAH
ncbi:hypothetical protein CYMTET_36152 [Cymbomonas tetramitiformis]|uniref:Uncharacterized protein n=1 Tax=Cymbomonas tetramitiformis TaxID=36881 RepID=A0AAE0CGI2_9CHLO|nr:hypothetical protein CYMTET_36152 [Cymbomonas tetramitiformis]